MTKNIRPGIREYAPPTTLEATQVEITGWAWKVACRLEVEDCQWLRHWLSPVPFNLQWLCDDPLGAHPVTGADQSRHEGNHAALIRWCADEGRARRRAEKERWYGRTWSDPGDGADSTRGGRGRVGNRKRAAGKPGAQKRLF